MDGMKKPKRGEIWWADMGKGRGSEQAGTRPVLIIQNDVGNQFSPTVIVATLTDVHKKYIPTHVDIKRQQGLLKDSTITLEQIRTIDKDRLTNRMATLSSDDMDRVNKALMISVGLIETERR